MLTRAEQILLKKLSEQIESRADMIASGGVSDYPEYRENVGFIRGIKTAISLLEETNSELTKGER